MGHWVEKRRHSRQPVKIEGTGVAEGGLERHPLTIRNLSKAGAMAELAPDAPVADLSTLLFNHTLEPCRVIWRDGKRAGFEFIELP